MKKSFAVIGLGRFGLSLLKELKCYTDDIMAIDSKKEAVEKASEFVNQAFILDATNEKALKNVGIQNVDHVIISFGSRFDELMLIFVTLKSLGVKQITVRVDEDKYIPIFEKLGATDIISPQKIAGSKLANIIVSDTFKDYFKLADDFCIVEVLLEDIKPISVIDLNTRNEFDVNILLIKHDGKTFTPKATDIIYSRDTLYLFGSNSNILELTNHLKNL